MLWDVINLNLNLLNFLNFNKLFPKINKIPSSAEHEAVSPLSNLQFDLRWRWACCRRAGYNFRCSLRATRLRESSLSIETSPATGLSTGSLTSGSIREARDTFFWSRHFLLAFMFMYLILRVILTIWRDATAHKPLVW